DEFEAARSYVEAQGGGPVIKADGLAKGKGVIVPPSKNDALEALDLVMVRRKFGAAGDRVVIEERLSGCEVSAHAFTDGETVLHMPFSCDHKPVFDGDHGPNTGGMGAYSPPVWLDESTAQAIRSGVTETAVRAMRKEGRPYRGVLYPGLMITADGPMVIEFNCRFGDPEAQALLPRLESDLLEALWAVATNRLHEIELRWSEEACVAVVVAAGGYPGSYDTGLPIEGLSELDPGVHIFQAGTSRREDGALLTAGGRVLTVSATGASLEDAREKAYRNVERVRFDGAHYRRDIGAATAAATIKGA
ncbi:MAG: phosphoribosylamine--glycine ligase, partial [Dehalococcoidia bacterium]|nr:phosphoribosylamine--glycine ligase [Dehalococcoidia bacterium]